MHILKKVAFILDKKQKKGIIFLMVLVLIGMLIEFVSLGMLMPTLNILIDSKSISNYPLLTTFLKFIGNPTRITFVLSVLLILVTVYLAKALYVFYMTWEQQKFSANLSSDLSIKLFKGYLNAPYSFHLNRNSALLIRNIQVEVGVFSGLTNSMLFFVTEISVIISIAMLLFILQPIGSILVLIILSISGFLFFHFTKKKLAKWGENRQVLAGSFSKILIQSFGGVKEIMILGKEKYFINEFNLINKENAIIQTKVNTLNQIPRVYLELLAVFAISILILFMLAQNKSNDFILPTLSLFVASAFRMIPSINKIMAALQNITYSKPVVNTIFDELSLFSLKMVKISSEEKLTFNRHVKIQDLSFKYQNSETFSLTNINIEIFKNNSIGIMGQSGSGKSTLIDILIGLHSPNSGNILVDEVNVNNNMTKWHNIIGYVPQTIFLIDESIKKNIAFGIIDSEIDNVALQNAIECAQLSDFILNLENGLETNVGERGVKLSGGQRQRIGIARALYNNPHILILDEASSALDIKTENDFMQSIKKLKGSITIIIVAHRLTTLNDCDLIYELNNGKIIKKGTPELMIN